MLKKPSTKPGRITLLVLETWGGLTALAIIALLIFESLDPIHATLWHMRHGNAVSFDGHVFHLPHSWYPDPDSHPGQLTLHHAQFGGVGISSITLAIRPQTLNDQDAAERIASETANLNKHAPASSEQWRTETLGGRKLTFHCAMSSTAGAAETLVCQAAESNLTIFALAAGRAAHADTLNLIETSE